MQIQIGDDVTHNGYPVGTLIGIRNCFGNGESVGLVNIYGHSGEPLAEIPMRDLRVDARYTEAAL